jgi:sugar diacid utilization regulator
MEAEMMLSVGRLRRGELPAARWAEIVEAYDDVAVASLNTPQDLDAVLHRVAQHICGLVQVDRCSMYLLGPDGIMRGRVGHSPGVDIDDKIRLLIAGVKGDDFTREILGTKAPVVVHDAQTDARTVQTTMRRWRVRSMLGVPLLVDDEVIGVVYLDDRENDRDFTAHDVGVASAFARLSSLAIRHSCVIGQLVQQRRSIEFQKRELEQLAAAHSRLTGVAVTGADPSQILQQLNTLVGNPVVLYDTSFVPITRSGEASERGPSCPVLHPSAITSKWFQSQIDQLRYRGSVLVPPAPSMGVSNRRLICPIRIDDERVGYLGVVEVSRTISVTDIKIIEQASNVLALAMLAEQRTIAALRHAREDFLADLVEARRDPPTLLRRGPSFGIGLAQPHALVKIQHGRVDDGLSNAERRARLWHAFDSGTDIACRASLGSSDGDLFLLGPLRGADAAALEDVRQLVQRALRRLTGDGPPCWATVSRILTNPDDYPTGYREVTANLELVAGLMGQPRVLLPADLGTVRLLALTTASQRKEASEFAVSVLEPLLDYDRSAPAELISTLRAFLRAEASIRVTAKVLGVHENTVRYRLSRVREISSIDPDRLEDLMRCQLALQVLDLCGWTSPDAPPYTGNG